MGNYGYNFHNPQEEEEVERLRQERLEQENEDLERRRQDALNKLGRPRPIDTTGATEADRIAEDRPVRSFTNRPELLQEDQNDPGLIETGQENVQASEPGRPSYWEDTGEGRLREPGQLASTEMLRERPEEKPIKDITDISWPELQDHLMKTQRDGRPDPFGMNIAKEAELAGEVGTPEYKKEYDRLSAVKVSDIEFLTIQSKIYEKKYAEKQKEKKYERTVRVNSRKLFTENTNKVYDLQKEMFTLVKDHVDEVTGEMIPSEEWDEAYRDRADAIRKEARRIEDENKRILANYPDFDPKAGLKVLGVDKTVRAGKTAEAKAAQPSMKKTAEPTKSYFLPDGKTPDSAHIKSLVAAGVDRDVIAKGMKAELEGTFDPEGEGYDDETAKAAGLKPDKTGHMQSREPKTGQILKGMTHETIDKTIQGEKEAGYTITKGEDGKYYSKKDKKEESTLHKLRYGRNKPEKITKKIRSKPVAEDVEKFPEPAKTVRKISEGVGKAAEKFSDAMFKKLDQATKATTRGLTTPAKFWADKLLKDPEGFSAGVQINDKEAVAEMRKFFADFGIKLWFKDGVAKLIEETGYNPQYKYSPKRKRPKV